MPPEAKKISVLNTRLFPRKHGANAYQLTGIAARCDWTVLTDRAAGTFDAVVRGDLAQQPRTIFISLRSIFEAIPFFYREVLPRISVPFVLVSGSEDVTIPNQLDARWRKYNDQEKGIIEMILNDRRLIHWFVENRDEPMPKTSSLPVGYVFEDGAANHLTIPPIKEPVAERPLSVFCAHRVREGPQWEARRRVTHLCRSRFKRFVTLVGKEIPIGEYTRAVQSHPFVLCVQGGGLDPSPKAWFCLANGAIPIIKSSALDDAYAQLPVAFVDDWNEACLSLEKLHAWREKLSPYYDDEVLRQKTLDKLTIDFWWEKIMGKWQAYVKSHTF